MRVLWLTDLPMPELAIAIGKKPFPSQGWIPALADALKETEDLELAVATSVRGEVFLKRPLGGIDYYVLEEPKARIRKEDIHISLVNQYQRVLDEFKPDIIHIHGTENYQGLLSGRGYLDCPTVISVQGIIDVCRKYYWGGMPVSSVLRARTLRDWVTLDGLLEQKIRWNKRAKWEREVFRSNQAFIGRTTWDKAHVHRLNPQARYYHCDELLRQPFYDYHWDVTRINRHTIFTSRAGYPLKGLHVLIKAVALLQEEFPNISVRTPLATYFAALTGMSRFWKNRRATGYARYLTELIRKKGLVKQFVRLESLDAIGMASEFRDAHLFVLPSAMENSPNSLAESMLVGTPSVSSFVGGVSSMAQDGETALFFPSGDEAVLAEQIRRVFLDDRLAERLSGNARRLARIRHSKEKIMKDMLNIYRTECTDMNY